MLENSLRNILALFKDQKEESESIYNTDNLRELEKRISYKFKNRDLLKAAITHSSHLREIKKGSHIAASERMEFLGDSILGMIVAEFLFVNNPHVSEGKLSKLKAKIVSEKYLFIIAQKLELEKYIILSKEEDESGGRRKPSIVSDLTEALICAIYLDGGLKSAQKFIIRYFLNNYKKLIKKDLLVNFKSKLQEFTQSKYQEPPTYKTVDVNGPDHKRIFTVQVWINDSYFGEGIGKSKKAAQQAAAKVACQKIGLC